MQVRKIKWDDEPLAAFKAAITCIRKQSPQNADEVKVEILEQIGKLATHPKFIHLIDGKRATNKSSEPLSYITFVLVIRQRSLK